MLEQEWIYLELGVKQLLGVVSSIGGGKMLMVRKLGWEIFLVLVCVSSDCMHDRTWDAYPPVHEAN